MATLKSCEFGFDFQKIEKEEESPSTQKRRDRDQDWKCRGRDFEDRTQACPIMTH